MLQDRLSTGIPGLDEVLHTGFVSRRAYLVRGGTGTGKTTLGLHFLATGATYGEQVLYILFMYFRCKSAGSTLGMGAS